MNTRNRRSFVALAAAAPLLATRVFAQDHGSHGEGHHGEGTPAATPGEFSCSVAMATPEITPYASDIPFDRAYIDTMIPHHASVVALAEVARDELEDERLAEIAQAILDTQPGEMEQLQTFRKEWYGSAEPDEMDHEMMMVAMAGIQDCGGEDHMNLMDSEWMLEQYNGADDKDLAFIDLVIPHHEMAVHQSMVALELAEHEELKTFAQDVIDAQTAEIDALKTIRGEIMSEP